MQELKTCKKCSAFVWIESGFQECDYCLGSNNQTRQYKREMIKKENETKKRHQRILLSLNKYVIFVLFVCLVLSSCVARSKYVVKLSKTVEANSKNHDDLVNALDANNVLPKDAINPLKANAKKTHNYASDLAKENPSALTWSSFNGVLDGFVLVSNAIGSYFGVPSGTIEKGIALITLVGGLFGHKAVIRRKEKEAKRKVKIAEKLNPEISKAYREAELKTIEEEKKA